MYSSHLFQTILLLVLVSLLGACAPITRGQICYQYSPLLANEDVEWIAKTHKDSIYLRVNESIVKHDWSPQNSKACAQEYTFDKDLVRVRKKTKNTTVDRVRLYEADKMQAVIYQNKSDIKTDTLQHHWRYNKGWEVAYEIVEYKPNVEKRLGFHCDYYKIIEHKSTGLGNTVFQYEVLATPKIIFPAELSIGLYDKLLPYCPLEITITDMACPKYYSKIIAKKFDKKFDPDYFDVNKIFNIQ
jgi:hypothetical protein